MRKGLTISSKARHPVVVLRNQGTTQDQNGQRIDDWREFARPFAYVRAISGTEPLVAGQRQVLITHTVEMFAVEGLTPKMRVKHKNKVLHIEEIVPTTDTESEIRCLCYEAA